MSLRHLLMLAGLVLGVLAWLVLAKALRGRSLAMLSDDADGLAAREESPSPKDDVEAALVDPPREKPEP